MKKKKKKKINLLLELCHKHKYTITVALCQTKLSLVNIYIQVPNIYRHMCIRWCLTSLFVGGGTGVFDNSQRSSWERREIEKEGGKKREKKKIDKVWQKAKILFTSKFVDRQNRETSQQEWGG